MSISQDADNPSPRRAGRSGGRQARRDLRAAPLTEDIKPVRAGLSGNTYKPLSETDVEQVHAAVLDVLENIGLSQATPTCVEACERVGAIFGDDQRLRFPRTLVLDTIKNANRNLFFQ